MEIVRGTLHAYWEQGFEGWIAYTLLRDRGDLPPTASRVLWLQDGQLLRIFEPTGGLLWEGTIELVPRRRFLFFTEQHELHAGIWNDRTQQGVPYRTWIGWFWHDPPLRAELTLPG